MVLRNSLCLLTNVTPDESAKISKKETGSRINEIGLKAKILEERIKDILPKYSFDGCLDNFNKDLRNNRLPRYVSVSDYLRGINKGLPQYSETPIYSRELGELGHQLKSIGEVFIKNNIGLSFSATKHNRRSVMGFDFEDLHSVALSKMFDCVRLFQWDSEYMFSTYYYNAVKKAFWKLGKQKQKVIYVGDITAVETMVSKTTPPPAISEGISEPERERLKEALNKLSEEEGNLLKIRFGLGDNRTPSSIRDTQTKLGITRVKLELLWNNALKNLRNFLDPSDFSLG